ncbi:hypothetical protein [Faecalibacterium prausnitzii]|uniref:hypothetical protein n=1 Tax=Faecalibacterium prausnitzii TaxID=853 RepID=UPI003A8028E8
MKMVANETELRNALKEKAQEITIVTSYADKVMERYGADLTAFINPAVAALVAGPLRLGLARYLQWYKIQSYTKGNLVIERKFL